MKAYGHKSYDQISCRYGCCTTSYGKMKDCREQADKQRRKTARQVGKKDIFTGLISED